jgi:hypothetical protein
MGLVVTSTVLEATEVRASERIHSAKCRARKAPASSASPSCRRVMVRSEARSKKSAAGATASAAKVSRQAATASDSTPSPWAMRAQIAPAAIDSIPPTATK